MRQKHVPLAHIAKVMVPGVKYTFDEFALLTGIEKNSSMSRVASMNGEGLISKIRPGKYALVYATPKQIEMMQNKSEFNAARKGKRNPSKQVIERVSRSKLDVLLFSTAIV